MSVILLLYKQFIDTEAIKSVPTARVVAMAYLNSTLAVDAEFNKTIEAMAAINSTIYGEATNNPTVEALAYYQPTITKEAESSK